MRILFIALAGLAFALAPGAHAQKAGTAKSGGVEKPRGDVMFFDKDDPEMTAARERAQAEVPDFLLHVTAPSARESRFMVKFDLLPEEEGAEFIWADIVSRPPGAVTVLLANDPIDDRFKRGQTVTVRDEQIVDWSYVRDGVVQGNYTTRVMLDRMPAEKADPIRRNLGW